MGRNVQRLWFNTFDCKVIKFSANQCFFQQLFVLGGAFQVFWRASEAFLRGW